MSTILHLETSSPVCSVAISSKSELLCCIESDEPNVHSSQLSVFIHKILKETGTRVNGLSAVAVSNGPGSYTGLRIGLSTAKGICYGADIPLITINSLQAMAAWFLKKNTAETYTNALIIPLIDARRQEVYAGYYDTHIHPVKQPQSLILNEKSFGEMMMQHTCLFIGNGAKKTQAILKNSYNSKFYPEFTTSAAGMTDLARYRYQQKDFANVAYAEPFYLKEVHTTFPKEKAM